MELLLSVTKRAFVKVAPVTAASSAPAIAVFTNPRKQRRQNNTTTPYLARCLVCDLRLSARHLIRLLIELAIAALHRPGGRTVRQCLGCASSLPFTSMSYDAITSIAS